jgi:cell pole-organizing protein PopZ
MTSTADDTPDKDQSMDDILASIRRIMLDEQARLQDGTATVTHLGEETPHAETTHPAPERPHGVAEDVLILDDSMAIEGASATPPLFVETTELRADVLPADDAGIDLALPMAHDNAPAAEVTVKGGAASPILAVTPQSIEALLAPAAAAAAASSVDALLRQLSDERLALLRPTSSSPSIEEVVRSELRPLLKSWLDENLPSLVERLVRAELARLTGRPGL